MKEEELIEKCIKLKKPLFDEFKTHKTDIDYTQFCLNKLKEHDLTEKQIIVASSLIDLGIEIGKILEKHGMTNKNKPMIIPNNPLPPKIGYGA